MEGPESSCLCPALSSQMAPWPQNLPRPACRATFRSGQCPYQAHTCLPGMGNWATASMDTGAFCLSSVADPEMCLSRCFGGSLALSSSPQDSVWVGI